MTRWRNLEDRINAIKGLVTKLGKDPKETVTEDFKKNEL